MKNLLSILTQFVITVLCLSTVFAQYEPYTQKSLPDGAIARFGKGDIWRIEYSPDDTRVAVTTSIGVWIYDSQTGEELDLITGGHTDRVYSAAYSPDGKTLVAVRYNKTVQLWNVSTGKRIGKMIKPSKMIHRKTLVLLI